jgi:predicted TIM-barrel fold metal-dependent hydrolase
VAVKIWKSIGLDLKTASGRYVMPDDPAFAPVFDMMAKSGKTLLAHLAEPKASWGPLSPNDPNFAYYRDNPAWHMYKHPERPSYETVIAARDRMLKAHPGLRVVGCHLGSMEHDVDEIAKRLDQFPNFAVDTAARVPSLKGQDREKVRAFLIRYQDRVLWGTDQGELTWTNPAASLQRWERAYANDWKYFAEDLALPPAVLRKIFHDNALNWIPGLRPGAGNGSND